MKRSDGTRIQTPELIRTFFDCAVAAVEVLDGEPGFRYDRRLRAMTGSDLEDVTPEQAEGWFFFAGVSFETSRLAGEISYGDREFFINLIVGQRASGREGPMHGLWEFANALGRSDERANGGSFVLDVDRVRRVVEGLGHVLAQLWPSIADAGPEVFAKMNAAREEAQRAFAQEMARHAHASMAAHAAAAFRAGDYARTVQLLESQMASLTPAERVKLQLARKYLQK